MGVLRANVLRKGLARPYPHDTARNCSSQTATGDNEYRGSLGHQALQLVLGCNDQKSIKDSCSGLKGNLKRSHLASICTASFKIPCGYSFPTLSMLESGGCGHILAPTTPDLQARGLLHSWVSPLPHQPSHHPPQILPVVSQTFYL